MLRAQLLFLKKRMTLSPCIVALGIYQQAKECLNSLLEESHCLEGGSAGLSRPAPEAFLPTLEPASKDLN